MQDDTTIYPIMNDLLDCVQVELTKRGIPVPCKIALESGLIAVIDFSEGCPDQLWVRLETAFPSTSFPQVDQLPSKLVSSPLAYTLEVGLSRDFIPENDGYMTADEKNAVARQMLAEMTAMRVAICKCLDAAGRDYQLSTYAPDVQGFAFTGTWHFFVASV
jgi:hypothetical protein